MKLRLTKMHGAGNDFVVIDATRGMPPVSLAQWRWLADRHVGVGADQILIVERPTAEQVAAAGPRGWISSTGSSMPTASRWSSAATARAASCASCTSRG